MRRFLNSITIPMRVAIAGSLIVAVINLVFLGAIYQRRNAVDTLQENIQTMEENLNTLKEIDQERLDSLKEERDEAQAQLEALQNAFPELGAPFALYHQGNQIASQNLLVLAGISLQDTETIESPNGPLQAKDYSLDLEGTLWQCIRFLDDLEQAGEKTLILDNITISPEEKTCSLDVRALGLIEQQ